MLKGWFFTKYIFVKKKKQLFYIKKSLSIFCKKTDFLHKKAAFLIYKN